MFSKLQRLRVANADCLSALPYRVLANLDFVTYEEGSPLANAIKLHEGSVDLALIPVEELASYGGYVGIDFGVACEGPADGMAVCHSHGEEDLHTVYHCEAIRTAEILEKVIASLDVIGGRGKRVEFLRPTNPFDVWTGITGRPFVFLVWAMRPASLDLSRLRALNEVLHRCNRASETILRQIAGDCLSGESSCVTSFGRTHRLYLDTNTIDGLNDFLARAARAGALPRATYRAATFTILSKHSAAASREPLNSAALQSLLAGGRLSIADALELSREGSLADLALVTESLAGEANRESGDMALAEIPPGSDESIRSAARKAVERGATHLVLDLSAPQRTLEDIEDLVSKLSEDLDADLEAISPPMLLELARASGLPIGAVARRLTDAGLDCLDARDLPLLVASPGEQYPSSADLLLDCIAEAAKSGAAFSCGMLLQRDHTWEQRLVHLHRLRNLQDRFDCFRYFELSVPSDCSDKPNADLKLRAQLVCRLFLVNVKSVILDDIADSLSKALGHVFDPGGPRLIPSKAVEGGEAKATRGAAAEADDITLPAMIRKLQFFGANESE